MDEVEFLDDVVDDDDDDDDDVNGVHAHFPRILALQFANFSVDIAAECTRIFTHISRG